MMQPMEQRNKTKKIGTRFLLPVVLAILLLFIITSTGTAQTIMGDINGDGKVDVKDVVLIQKHVLGKISLTALQRDVADVNGDGLIDARDVALLMQRSIGKISTFPLQVTKVDEVIKQVAYGTPQAAIGLPSTVSATISNGAKRDISVQWETTSTPAYNPYVQGSYVFYGNLITLPSGITNPSAIKAKATVNISHYGPSPSPYPPYQYYALSVSASPTDGGTVSSSSYYLAGTAVPVTATASAGYTFANWTVGGVVVSTSSSFTYYMPANNVSLVANFTSALADRTSTVFGLLSTHDTVTITLTGGTFKAAPITASDFTFTGDNITALSSTSNIFTRTSSNIVTITGITGLVDSANNYVTVKGATQATQASAVTAVGSTGAIPVLSVVASPAAGGTVTGGGTYAQGTVVPVTATANAGYAFTNWTATAGSFVYADTVSTNYYNMPSTSSTVTANFAATLGVVISTSKTTPGVSFISGAFTSGEVTAAPASAVYNGESNTLSVADIVITINWSTTPITNGYTIGSIDGTNKTATATVYVYAQFPQQNTVNALRDAIYDVKNNSHYNGLLRATVTAATEQINISGIEENALAPASVVNNWRFIVTDTPPTTGFYVYQHNRTVAQQVYDSVAEAVYHVDSTPAVFKITVTHGASVSGNLIVNVKDPDNAIDEDVSVAVLGGNTEAEVAERIRQAFVGNSVVNANYTITRSDTEVTLTQVVGKDEDISVILK